MLNVCHIISGDLWAGAEKMAFSLLKCLAKDFDIRLFVILLNEGLLSRRIAEQGIPSLILDETRLPFLKILLRIKKIFNDDPPDIVHSHRYKENLMALLATEFGNTRRLVATQHGMPEDHDSSISFANRLKMCLNFRVLSKKFHSVVAVSHDIRDSFVVQHGFKGDRVVVIHNGIEAPNKVNLQRKNSSIVVGSAGRLFPVKGYPFMIEVAREVSRRTSEVVFELAGEGPGKAELEALIAKYGLQRRVRLRGFVEDMASFYRRLDVYMNTSLHEGVPMTVLEAMAYGLPIIAPRVGGLEEIVQNGVEGFLLPTRDPVAFAEKCIVLSEDQVERNRISLAARERVLNEFSAHHMAQEYYILYKALVG